MRLPTGNEEDILSEFELVSVTGALAASLQC